MINRAAASIGHKITLADIGNITRLLVFGEEVIERLIAWRANVFGDRGVPFLAIGEDRVDIEDHAAKIEQAMPDDIANAEAAA